jgi:nucleotide-binding universal stress UspA family protein
MFPVQTILCPTDFSDCSRSAFRLAGSLARAHGARLLVLHVNPPLGPLVAAGQARAQLQPPDHPERLWHALHRFQVPDANVRLEHQLAEGDPAREILRVAGESRCDLIVMGTHGRTDLERLLLGSVAERVLRQARCPVVTVKPARQPASRPAASTPAGAASHLL